MGRWGRWLGAACLVLFPLLFIVFAGTDIHPGPSGTTQEQIRLVAAAEGRWRLVHLVLAAASLLGIGAVATVWMLAVRGRSEVLAWSGDLGLVLGGWGGAAVGGGADGGRAGGAAGGGPRQLGGLPGSREGRGGRGHRRAGLEQRGSVDLGRGPLATGLLLLGLVGGLLRTLRIWEAALLVLAAIGLVFTNPGLHVPTHYPLLFVLVVFGSLALRWLTGGAAAAGRSPAGLAARGAPAAPG
jgi:hypothetical protein